MEFGFRGLMAPVFTPFSERMDLDLSKIPPYVDYLESKGIKGVLVNGTTGEGVSMTVDERKSVLECWVNSAHRLTIMAQIGGDCLTNVCSMARHAGALDVGAILCLPDLFFRPTTVRQLVDYLQVVSQSAPRTPLFYYHIPSFTGVNLDMEEFLKLGRKEISTLAGIKYTHTDLEHAVRCLNVDSESCNVFLGADQILAGACIYGFDSAIATTLNIFPSLLQDIMESMVGNMESGDITIARECQELLNNRIRDITNFGGWVPTMKEAMRIVTGLDFGWPRLPLKRLEPEQIESLQNVLS